MRNDWWLLLGVVVLAGSAQANGRGGRSQGAQGVDIRGQVDRFTLSAGGQLDGFLLDDGTEVHVAANMAAQLGHAVQQGNPVQVREVQVPGSRLVIASSVTSESTQETITNANRGGV